MPPDTSKTYENRSNCGWYSESNADPQCDLVRSGVSRIPSYTRRCTRRSGGRYRSPQGGKFVDDDGCGRSFGRSWYLRT